MSVRSIFDNFVAGRSGAGSSASADGVTLELISTNRDSTVLKVGLHRVQVIDPLEGSPLILADAEGATSATQSWAERANERLERAGGRSTFENLLAVLSSVPQQRAEARAAPSDDGRGGS